MPAGSPIDQWWKSHRAPKAEKPDTAVDVNCPECGQRLGSSSDAGAARRMVAWHREHCTATLDIFATHESSDLSSLRDGTPSTARAIAQAEARERLDEAAAQASVDRLFPPLGPSEPCTTPGCSGDWRYAAPGRGHILGCRYPLVPEPTEGESV